MQTLYVTLLACILASGVFLAGVYWKQMVARYKRLLRRNKRNSLAARIEQLEKRVELHTRKDGVYLDKFDQLEEELSNVAAFSKRRQVNLKKQIREEVRNYLKELQK